MAPGPFWLLGSVFRGSTLLVFSIRRVCGALLLLLRAHSHLGGSFTEVFLSRSLLHVCTRACAFWPLSLSLKGCLPCVMLTRIRHAGKMSQLNGPEGDSFVRCQACGKIKASWGLGREGMSGSQGLASLVPPRWPEHLLQSKLRAEAWCGGRVLWSSF